MLVNRWGLVVGWVWAPAHRHEVPFQPVGQAVEGRLVGLAARSFQAATGEPANLNVCCRGEWNERMLIATVLSMLTTRSPLKQVSYRVAASVQARRDFMMAVFNLLTQWHGLPADEESFMPPSSPNLICNN